MSLTFQPRLPAGTPNPDSFWGEDEFGPFVSLNYGDAITLFTLLRDDASIDLARQGGIVGESTVAALRSAAYRAADWLQFVGSRGAVPSFGIRVPVNSSSLSDVTHKVEVAHARELLSRLVTFLNTCKTAGVGLVQWS